LLSTMLFLVRISNIFSVSPDPPSFSVHLFPSSVMLFIVCSFSSSVALLPLPVAHLLRLFIVSNSGFSSSPSDPSQCLYNQCFPRQSFSSWSHPILGRLCLPYPVFLDACGPHLPILLLRHRHLVFLSVDLLFSSSRVLVDLGVLFVLFLPCVS